MEKNNIFTLNKAISIIKFFYLLISGKLQLFIPIINFRAPIVCLIYNYFLYVYEDENAQLNRSKKVQSSLLQACFKELFENNKKQTALCL